VAGGKRSFSIGSAESAEYDHFPEIDEGEARRTHDNVVHQQSDALGVVNHRHTSAEDAGVSATPLPLQGELWMLKRPPTIKGFPSVVKVNKTV
jgi:hypothetical protein